MMKSVLVLLFAAYINCDAVCLESVFRDELEQDIKDNGKLDCLRKVRPADPEVKEDEQMLKNRLAAVWDSDCSFEAEYDWLKYLVQNYGLKNGLVDADGNNVAYDFPDQADMCEMVRALVAGGQIPGKKEGMTSLDTAFIEYIDCPDNGLPNVPEICAVSGQSAGMNYSWTIFLQGKAIQIAGKPIFQKKK